MALRGDARIVVDDQCKPRRCQLQHVECDEGSLDVVRRRRPMKFAVRKRDRIDRRHAAWVVMRNAGMTLAEIREATGDVFALSTICEGIQAGKRKATAALKRRNSRYGT